MKFTDGLFHKVFDEVGAEYPEIEKEHWIVDIGAAKLADTPEAFDVIVMPNLYGDILSDVAAQIAGSVGLAGSANIGDQCAMFEAIHGSAPRRAGQNLANPSGLLHGGLLMLVHIGQPEIAEAIHNAWLRTIEDGVHTYDIYKPGISKQKVGTKEFADAVVARLGQRPEKLKPAAYSKAAKKAVQHTLTPTHPAKKELVGVDVFLHWTDRNPQEFGKRLEQFNGDGLKLKSLSNRGVNVYPDGFEETFCTDHWRVGFMSEKDGAPVSHKQVVSLLDRIQKAGLDFIKIENLYTFDGQKGFTASQGE
jgi:isocitrate dehydrogenase